MSDPREEELRRALEVARERGTFEEWRDATVELRNYRNAVDAEEREHSRSASDE